MSQCYSRWRRLCNYSFQLVNCFLWYHVVYRAACRASVTNNHLENSNWKDLKHSQARVTTSKFIKKGFKIKMLNNFSHQEGHFDFIASSKRYLATGVKCSHNTDTDNWCKLDVLWKLIKYVSKGEASSLLCLLFTRHTLLYWELRFARYFGYFCS